MRRACCVRRWFGTGQATSRTSAEAAPQVLNHNPAWEASRYEQKPVFENEANPSELRWEHFATAKVVSIHRDEQQNTLTRHLCERIGRAVSNMNRGSVTSFFVLKGSQVSDFDQRLVTTERDRYFCTGADLRQLRGQWAAGQRDEVLGYLWAETEMTASLINCTKPWAAGLNGTVVGAGAGLAMHATFKFVSGAAVWALPETSYGGVPGYGSSFELPHLEDYLGTYLALTGRRVVGHDLIFAGLGTHVMDSGLYGEVCEQVAMQNSWEMQHILPVLSCFDQQGSAAEEPYALEPHLHTIGNCFRHDSIEKIREALKEEGTHFAKQTLRKLDSKSPAALKLTLRLLRQGQDHDAVSDSLVAEYAVQKRLWEDEESDLHYGLKHVALAEGAISADLAWPSRSKGDEYVEKLLRPLSADEHPFQLSQEIAPRPPKETPQLLRYYSEIAALEDAPPPTDAHLSTVALPDAEAEQRIGAAELRQVFEANMHRITPKKTYWHVEEADSSEDVKTVQKTERGEAYFARDSKSSEWVEVPEAVKQQILDAHPNAAHMNIIRTELFDVHPTFDYEDPMQVAAFRDAIDEGARLDQVEAARDKGEDAPLPYDLDNTDRVVTSESLGEVFARPFHSIDEELEAMLRVMGHVEKRPEDTNTDELPNYHNERPVMDKRPLTPREEKL